MLDVPKKIHGLRVFLLHILTITMGLLIALSLESFVDGVHHRELLRDAKASMHAGIAHNAQRLAGIRKQMADEEKTLDNDLTVLLKFRDKATDVDGHQKLLFTFESTQLDDAAWRTAQTAGAFTYVPYGDAEEFSAIYDVQDDFRKAQQQVNDLYWTQQPSCPGLADAAKPTDGETLRPSTECVLPRFV
jgi:hypothetical protein